MQENKKSAIRSDGEMLLACLDSDSEQIKADVGDEAIIFYVSGYTAFKEMKRSNCVSLLAKEKEAPVICFDLEEPKISGQEVDSASNEANSIDYLLKTRRIRLSNVSRLLKSARSGEEK